MSDAGSLAGADALQATLRRILSGIGTSADLELVREAWMDRRLELTGASRSVTIDGSVLGSTISTGDQITNVERQITLDGADSPTLEQVLAATLPSLHQLPPPPGDFTGRDAELSELTDAFMTGQSSVVLLHGMGGTGKTALALKLGERLTPRFPDAQLYLDLNGTAEQPLTVAEAQASVIRAFVPLARLPEAEAELTGLYRSVLSEKRALLLLDNGRDGQHVAPLIPPAACGVLVTTRRHFALAGMMSRGIGRLGEPEARRFLLTITPRIGNHADAISRLCGCLPLALRLAGSALAVRLDLDPAEYAQRLIGEETRLGLLDASVGLTVEARGIEASLSLSYELLGDELQGLWRGLAVFQGSFDRTAAAALWNLDHQAGSDYLGVLVGYSLVEWEPSSGRYRLHELARLFAAERLSGEELQNGQLRHARHYFSILIAAGESYLRGGQAFIEGLSLFDREWSNVQAGWAWAASRSETVDEAAALCSLYPDAGAYLFPLRQPPLERIRWREIALAAARRLGDRNLESLHLGTLGSTHLALGEPLRAIEYLQAQLEIARDRGDRRGEGSALGEIGYAYLTMGDPRHAIELCEQALAIHHEVAERRGIAAWLETLGSAYGDLGDPVRAAALSRQSLEIHLELGDRRGEATLSGNLALALRDLGQHDEARALHERQLEISRQIGDRGEEALALDGLGSIYLKLDQPATAIGYYERALPLLRDLGDRRREGNVRTNLGSAYFGIREFGRAVDQYEQALANQRAVNNRRGEGLLLLNLGLALDKLGDRTQAVAHLEDALQILQILGDPQMIRVVAQLAYWRGTD